MYIKKLLQSEKTIFSTDDFRLIFGLKMPYLSIVIGRLIKKGDLIRIKKGLYCVLRQKNLNHLELAKKLKSPSYISMETVLAKEGVVFQDYSQTIFCISNNSVTIKILGLDYKYYKMKDSVLLNPLGINNDNGFMIASVERAICDRLYFSPKYYFDNIDNIDKEKIIKISKIYNNKRLEKEVKNLISQC